jgi:hypothetical protein
MTRIQAWFENAGRNEGRCDVIASSGIGGCRTEKRHFQVKVKVKGKGKGEDVQKEKKKST